MKRTELVWPSAHEIKSNNLFRIVSAARSKVRQGRKENLKLHNLIKNMEENRVISA